MESKLADMLLRLPAPYYTTQLGAAFLGDSKELLKMIPDGVINLVVTSPPFALQRKKEYGNVGPDEYVAWFLPFAKELWRVLADDGSLVIHIGGSWQRGRPVKTLYHFQLLLDLCHDRSKVCESESPRFYLAQDFYWFNPSKLPAPAEWVTVRRVRAKDAVEPIWWLSKSPTPKADNRRVLRDYSVSMLELLKKGYKAKLRPSGHDISTKFEKNLGGSIPPNLLMVANTESNSYYLRACRQSGIRPHPARYPARIPDFFIRFLTTEGDIVLDPFGGSNVTGEAAERLGRGWIAFEISESYLNGSRFRFQQGKLL